MPEEVPAERSIAHLEILREDARDEIKKRIEQRDKYSIQLTLALGVIFAVSFSPTGLSKAVIAAPLVSIYFTVLILYSYRIHTLLARYLREEIEPELAGLCGIDAKKELQEYFSHTQVRGIRRGFFITALWIISAVSLSYLWFTENKQPEFVFALIFVTIVYTVAVIGITVYFWKPSK